MKRVFLIVLDSVGIGEMPEMCIRDSQRDADELGDSVAAGKQADIFQAVDD